MENTETKAEPIECPGCGEIQLELRGVETTPDGIETSSYECMNCGRQVTF